MNQNALVAIADWERVLNEPEIRVLELKHVQPPPQEPRTWHEAISCSAGDVPLTRHNVVPTKTVSDRALDFGLMAFIAAPVTFPSTATPLF